MKYVTVSFAFFSTILGCAGASDSYQGSSLLDGRPTHKLTEQGHLRLDITWSCEGNSLIDTTSKSLTQEEYCEWEEADPFNEHTNQENVRSCVFTTAFDSNRRFYMNNEKNSFRALSGERQTSPFADAIADHSTPAEQGGLFGWCFDRGHRCEDTTIACVEALAFDSMICRSLNELNQLMKNTHVNSSFAGSQFVLSPGQSIVNRPISEVERKNWSDWSEFRRNRIALVRSDYPSQQIGRKIPGDFDFRLTLRPSRSLVSGSGSPACNPITDPNVSALFPNAEADGTLVHCVVDAMEYGSCDDLADEILVSLKFDVVDQEMVKGLLQK